MARATKKASPSKTNRTRSSARAKKPAKKSTAKRPVVKKTTPKKTAPKKPAPKKPAVAPKKTAQKKTAKATKKPAPARAKASKPVKKTSRPPAPKKKVAKQVTAATKSGKPSGTVGKSQAPTTVKQERKAKERVAIVETAAKKPRKPELTPKEIQAIRAQLEDQKTNFLREYNELEEGAFTASQSEMSGEVSFDEEYADAGTFTFEREKELSIGNNIRDLLDRVNSALNAIDAGTYGLCENCGDPINKARLQALPYTTLCIRCKQLEERTR